MTRRARLRFAGAGPTHVLELLPDGRLAAWARSAPWAEHYCPGEWVVRTYGAAMESGRASVK